MKYKFHSDPGHGWLEVPKKELIELGIFNLISKYSYINPNNLICYLEEDCDAAKFIDAARKKGQTIKFEDIIYNNKCFVRDLWRIK